MFKTDLWRKSPNCMYYCLFFYLRGPGFHLNEFQTHRHIWALFTSHLLHPIENFYLPSSFLEFLWSNIPTCMCLPPPGSCTAAFQDEFISYVGFLSAIDHNICWDFNIHIDVPGGDGAKFLSLLETCNLMQFVSFCIQMVRPTNIRCKSVSLYQTTFA